VLTVGLIAIIVLVLTDTFSASSPRQRAKPGHVIRHRARSPRPRLRTRSTSLSEDLPTHRIWLTI
jgi:hypothetical protein